MRNKDSVLRKVSLSVRYTLLAVLGIVLLYPLFYAFFGSVTTQEAYDETMFLPEIVNFWQNLSNYGVLFNFPDLYISIFITLGRIVLYFFIISFVSVLGGYVFAHMNFPFKRTIFIVLLSGLMIPGIAVLVPNYVWMARFPLVGGNDITGHGGRGFIDNPAFWLVTGWVDVSSIFLVRQTFWSVDKEYAESGKIDGANFFRIVFSLYMPLIRPILAVIGLNVFLGQWNDFMTSYTYLAGIPQWHMIGTRVYQIMDYFMDPTAGPGKEFPKAFAVSFIVMLPPIVVYIFVQRQFVEGLAMGGVKG